jgi:sugar/nucleoside kinase (ribokinase family)
VRARLAVCGNVALDVIDGGKPTVGGGPYHCGAGLRLLERPSFVVARLAPGDRPLLVPPLAALGVPLRLLDAAQTASFGLNYDGETRRTEILAIGEPWRPEDAPAVGRTEWVHVAPLMQTDFPADTLRALARGRRVSYDGQGLVRAAELGPVRMSPEYDLEVLSHVTVLKLAEEEARAILPEIDEEAVFGLGVPEVVVTYGSEGSVVYAGGTSTPVPCHPIRDVELTGCGDAFGVGYLAARSDGLAPVAAARRATALVALFLSLRKRYNRRR